MKVLRFYPDTPSAHVAKSLLAAHEIDAFVADENLANIDPPVVFATGGVRLMVDAAVFERALAILQDRANDFELPDDWTPPEDEAQEPSLGEREAKAPAARLRWPYFLLGIMLGGGLVAFGFQAKMLAWQETGHTITRDLNGDGDPDTWTRFKGSMARTHSEDRNYDGEIDSRYVYDSLANLTSAELDNDFDGYFETTQTWQSRLDIIEKIHRHRWDHPDIEYVYEQGYQTKQLWRDSTGKTVKRANYEHGVKLREEWDADGDGIFERVTHFDAFENPVRD